METPAENIFDIDQFRSSFVTKVEDYGTNKYITYGRNSDPAENERKKARAEVLYQELLDDCAEALLSTEDKNAVMEIIHRDLVYKRYGNGYAILPPGAQTDFYRDLSLRLAIKASAR
ncbi:hypothetical protein KJ632_04690 [Patescibacteria group bacterium]|nr:hypothetical protein [Patescibacteria group bacterium]